MMVAVIETVFVPVLIENYQTATAKDRATLKAFGERMAQYPVSRFVDVQRKDLIARTPDVWRQKDQSAALATLMLKALRAGKYDVPSSARSVLEGLRDGKRYDDAQVKAFARAMQRGLGRTLHASLNAAVKAYETRRFLAATKAARRVHEAPRNADEAKADADYLIKRVQAELETVKARATALESARDYLDLFELTDAAARDFKGLEGVAAWADAHRALAKDKQVRAEVKALKALAPLEERLAEAKDDKARARVLKELARFADANEGLRAGERAAALAGR